MKKTNCVAMIIACTALLASRQAWANPGNLEYRGNWGNHEVFRSGTTGEYYFAADGAEKITHNYEFKVVPQRAVGVAWPFFGDYMAAAHDTESFNNELLRLRLMQQSGMSEFRDGKFVNADSLANDRTLRRQEGEKFLEFKTTEPSAIVDLLVRSLQPTQHSHNGRSVFFHPDSKNYFYLDDKPTVEKTVKFHPIPMNKVPNRLLRPQDSADITANVVDRAVKSGKMSEEQANEVRKAFGLSEAPSAPTNVVFHSRCEILFRRQ